MNATFRWGVVGQGSPVKHSRPHVRERDAISPQALCGVSRRGREKRQGRNETGRVAATRRGDGLQAFGFDSSREWTHGVMSEEGTLEMKVEMRVVRTTQALLGDFEGGRKSVKDEWYRI
jgi:hypothetical protein